MESIQSRARDDGDVRTVGRAVGAPLGREEGPAGFVEGCLLGPALGGRDGRDDGSLGAAMQCDLKGKEGK